jgi:hypothetical protein
MLPVGLSGGQLTRTVTSQAGGMLAIVVVTLNCTSPG